MPDLRRLLSHRCTPPTASLPLHRWLLCTALLPVLWLAGCAGDPRQVQSPPSQPGATATTPTASPAGLTGGAVCPACLIESLSRVDHRWCRVDAAMLATPEEVLPNQITVILDPAHPYALHLAPRDTLCQLSAELAEITYRLDANGHAEIRDVRLSGHPAVVEDSQGRPLLVGTDITLHLDANGLSSVELPGGSGAMLAVPTMLTESSAAAPPSAPMADSVAIAVH
jgi:hypothetical protein